MNGAELGSKYLVEAGKTVQTVTCSFCGSSCSRHGSIAPPPLSASPRCFEYLPNRAFCSGSLGIRSLVSTNTPGSPMRGIFSRAPCAASPRASPIRLRSAARRGGATLETAETTAAPRVRYRDAHKELGYTVKQSGSRSYALFPLTRASPKKRASFMAGIFVSYARKDDASFVKQLHADLIARGFDVWLDKERMESRGRSFLQEI